MNSPGVSVNFSFYQIKRLFRDEMVQLRLSIHANDNVGHYLPAEKNEKKLYKFERNNFGNCQCV